MKTCCAIVGSLMVAGLALLVMPTNIGADMGVWASYSPDGSKLAINRHGQAYWRKC